MGELPTVPIPDPTYPKPRGCKSVTTHRAHRVGPLSGLITIMVMTLFPDDDGKNPILGTLLLIEITSWTINRVH